MAISSCSTAFWLDFVSGAALKEGISLTLRLSPGKSRYRTFASRLNFPCPVRALIRRWACRARPPV
jgi:hypothetical protein